MSVISFARSRLFFLTLFTAALLASFAATRAQAQVWKITKVAWTAADEQAFSAWVAKATAGEPESLFVKGRELEILGVSPVDCADFVYALRIIFASQNGLPFKSMAPTRGRAIDASRTDWNNQPAEKRLKMFLEAAFRDLSTKTLPYDTESVGMVSRVSIRPGVILLAAPDVGHSWVVRRVRDTGIPELVFGSVPDRTEVFFHHGLPRGEAVFGRRARNVSETSAGFRYWKSPGSPVAEKMNDTWEKMRPAVWRGEVLKTLTVRPESIVETISRQLTNICREVRTRAVLVTEAATIRQRGCMNPRDQYAYSTPNRDSRLKEGFLDLWEIWMTAAEFFDDGRRLHRGIPARSQIIMDQIDQVFSNRVLIPSQEDIVCAVDIMQGRSMNLRDIRANTINGRLSVDPNESILARWGLEGETGDCNRR